MDRASDLTPQIQFVAKGRIEAKGEAAARLVVAALFEASMWYEMTPLPDDRWAFDTKGEADRFLRQKLGVT